MKKRWWVIPFLFSGMTLCAMSPDEALDALVQGNKRFVEGKEMYAKDNSSARLESKKSQNPFAIIVACADSRVAPEILFDQTIGDLFVVRLAGNVVGPYALESIEFAADNFDSVVILVMGHENCGAVDAVLHGMVADILCLAQLIQPSIERALAQPGTNLLRTAIEMNARAMKRFLLKSSVIRSLKQQGRIDVHAAYYDFKTGQVQIL